MTDNEFRDRFKELLKEYDPSRKKDYLLTIVSFEPDNEPDEVFMLGLGCPVCIIEALKMQVEDGTIVHHDSNKNHKVH